MFTPFAFIISSSSWLSLVPTNLVSSSFIDTMIAPYVTDSVIGSNVYELKGGGNGTLSNGLSVSSNAIVGFENGVNSLSIPAKNYYFFTNDSTTNIGSPINQNTFEFWFKPNPWQDGTVPNIAIMNVANSGGNTTITTFNPYQQLFNPFTIWNTPTSHTENQTSWSNQWVYMTLYFEERWSGFDYQQSWDYTWRTKSGVSGSGGILYGSKQGPNNTNYTAVFDLFGYSSFSWGVIRHYGGVRLTAAEALANYNTEQGYF